MDDERSITDRLAELQQLRDDGLITDDEFAERRTSILDELTAAPSTPPTLPPPATSKSGTPGRWTPEEQAAYKAANPKKGMSTGAKVALGVVTVVAIFWALAALPGDDNRTGPPADSNGASFHGTVVSYEAENPASLGVTISMTNSGTKADNWECTVRASDPSGTYSGWDILSSTSPLGAGETDRYGGSLTITSEGAAYVTKVTLENCGTK